MVRGSGDFVAAVDTLLRFAYRIEVVLGTAKRRPPHPRGRDEPSSPKLGGRAARSCGAIGSCGRIRQRRDPAS
jgi:hypothetical protein